eukprot:m.26075 g.26075  ORF g.26075 m.26075 type:complete len:427 (-) comp15268_c2_seq1:53-1333(-)
MASMLTRLTRGVSVWSFLLALLGLAYIIFLRHTITQLTYEHRLTQQRVQTLRLHADLLERQKTEIEAGTVEERPIDDEQTAEKVQREAITKLEDQLLQLQRKYHDLETSTNDAVAKTAKLELRHQQDVENLILKRSDLGDSHPGPFLFVMVMTIPKAVEQRNAMRETWLQYRGDGDGVGSVLHRFMIGTATLGSDAVTALEEENKVYGDLALIPHFKEEFFNLTGKLLESMSWGIEAFGVPQYVFKVDDDTFVRLDSLLNELHAVPTTDAGRFYYGYFDGRAEVRRHGKYAEMGWTVCNRYLPYALGGGYVVSGAIVDLIVQDKTKMSLYSRFNAEDVSMGLWTAPLNITRRHDTRFDTEWKSRGCSNKYIVMHRSSPKDMHARHQMLLKTSFAEHCVEEFRNKRVEYEYNWTALPSECCPGRGLH